MATGIELPTKTVNGRLKLISGDEYIRQLIITAMLDGYSENPFENVGLGEFMIFDINDGNIEGEIRNRVEVIFESLESDQLARFEEVTFETSGSEKIMTVKYLDLEQGRRTEVNVPVPEGGF